MTDTSMAGDPEDMADQGADENTEDEVICTICFNASTGKFTMYAGDEPDEEAAGGASPDAAGAMGGAPPPGAGGGGAIPPGAEGAAGEPEAPQGESFDSAPELMRAVLEVVQQAEQGDGGEEAGMAAGYAEASPATQAAPSPIGPNS